MASDRVVRSAVQSGDLDAVRSAIAAGADLEKRHSGTGRTLLLEAVIAGQAEVTDLLLAHGADLTASCTAVGETALGWSAIQGHADVTRLLLARGAVVDAVARNSFLGRTPLHLAAQSGRLEICSMLLDAGADSTAADNRGDNALSLARGNDHGEVVQRLRAAGATEPEPIVDPEPIGWPELTWDPTELSGVADLPDDATAEQIVLSYICALDHWERQAWDENLRAREAESAFDFGPALAEAERLVALHTTDKVRKYSRSSIGSQPDIGPGFALIEVGAPTSSRRELLLQHPSPESFLDDYEWTFVCLRRGGRWRIDSARNRLRGTEKWRSVVL